MKEWAISMIQDIYLKRTWTQSQRLLVTFSALSMRLSDQLGMKIPLARKWQSPSAVDCIYATQTHIYVCMCVRMCVCVCGQILGLNLKPLFKIKTVNITAMPSVQCYCHFHGPRRSPGILYLTAERIYLEYWSLIQKQPDFSFEYNWLYIYIYIYIYNTFLRLLKSPLQRRDVS